jgi:hypothetical protein
VTAEQIGHALAALRATGVTRLLPTLITGPFDRFARCARAILEVDDPSAEEERRQYAPARRAPRTAAGRGQSRLRGIHAPLHRCSRQRDARITGLEFLGLLEHLNGFSGSRLRKE